MRFVRLALLALILPLPAQAELDVEMYRKLSTSILKVQAVRGDGVMQLGSAVMVAPGKFVTNCHVTRGAERVLLHRGSMGFPVESQVADVHHDVCMLSVAGDIGLIATPIAISTRRLAVGEPVFAAGFNGGRGLSLTEGEIQGLHQLDGARVIQTSAEFTSGASGGGLFNEAGQLIGIVTFRGMTNGSSTSYFALPVEWLLQFAANEQKARAFYEAQSEDQPYFLRAIKMESDGEWTALVQLAQEWALSENFNPEAWIALGKAYAKLRQNAQAISAFHQAVKYDPSHVGGWTQLGVLYLESGEFAEAHRVEVALSLLH
ncbi:MAG: trypsin-like peptidase domain-containing protein [Burkholderiales bacterium]